MSAAHLASVDERRERGSRRVETEELPIERWAVRIFQLIAGQKHRDPISKTGLIRDSRLSKLAN